MYGLFLESITTNDEEIKDIMYPLYIFMLLHETNKVYLSFTNEITHSLLVILRKTYQNNFLFSRVNRTVSVPKIFTRWKMSDK